MYKSLLQPAALLLLIICFAQCNHNSDNDTTPGNTDRLSGTYHGIRHIQEHSVRVDSLGTHVYDTDTSYVDSLVVTKTADSALLIGFDELDFFPAQNLFVASTSHHIVQASLPANTDSIYYEVQDAGGNGTNSDQSDIHFTGKK